MLRKSDKEKLGLILASFDPVAVDALGSELLGHDPNDLEYLTLADGLLGQMNGAEIVGGGSNVSCYNGSRGGQRL